jgi:hypothetical protein
MLNKSKEIAFENEETNFTICSPDNDKSYFKAQSIETVSAKDEGKQKSVLESRLKHLIKKKAIKKLKNQIETNIKLQINDLKSLLIFKRKYPVTFEREKMKIFYSSKDKILTDVDVYEKKQKNIDLLRTTSEKIKNETEIIRRSSFISFHILKKMFDHFVLKNINDLEIYLEYFQNELPFYVYADVLFILNKYFNLEKLKKKIHNPKNIDNNFVILEFKEVF